MISYFYREYYKNDSSTIFENKLVVNKKIRGRGRPRGFDVEQGLAVAMQLFHQYGFDGVGVAELAKKIGITPPSLYSAFGSKGGLFEQVLEKYVADESGWLISTLQENRSVELAISALFERASQVYTAHANQLGCLVLDGTRNCNDARACELGAKFRQGTWQRLCDRIAEEYPQSAPVLASYVLTILMGLSAAARDGRPESELKMIGEIAAAGFSARLS